MLPHTTRLPRDLSENEHIEAALQLDHPYAMEPKLEIDAQFVVELCARLGPHATSWRNGVLSALRRLAAALAPLDRGALRHRPTRHCAGWAPALTAAFVSILDWKDRELPWALVHGFQVVGAIPPSHIHRAVGDPLHSDAELRADLLGENAVSFIDKLEADLRVHQHADGILEATLSEIELGLARPLESKEEVDAVFGVGCWRPLPRHLVFQADKARPMDDARAGGHNDHSECAETIVCTSGEWPALVIKSLFARVRRLSFSDVVPA